MICALLLIVKVYFHMYIGNKNNNPIYLGSYGESFQVFWFYQREVDEEYEDAKKMCNTLFGIVFFYIYNNNLNFLVLLPA